MEIERDSETSSANNVSVIGHETQRSRKANHQPKNGSSKAFALLDTLVERMEKVYGNTAASRPLDLIGFHGTRVEAEATPSEIPGRLIDEISRLDHLLIQADNVSVAINSCYWYIGVSYREFCKVRSSPGLSRFLIAHGRPLNLSQTTASTQGLWRKTPLQNFVPHLP